MAERAEWRKLADRGVALMPRQRIFRSVEIARTADGAYRVGVWRDGAWEPGIVPSIAPVLGLAAAKAAAEMIGGRYGLPSLVR